VLDPLYHGVAWAIVHIHSGLTPIMSEGPAWALAIVLLTMAMRLVLFPLFVKQIKTQRQMQVLQPKIKELQAKHKGDRERLNTEMMALYKEHGANPLSGCLPILVQIPIFIALFHVLNAIKPKIVQGVPHYPTNVIGFPQHLIESAAQAKIFGVPIAAAFNSNPDVLHALHASQTSVKVLTTLMIVLMGVSTFFTQRQLMARTGATGSAATQQKVLLYILPFTFAIFGFRFPLGVLLYWLTSNFWSMAQQFFVIRRMPPAMAGAGASGPPPPKPVRQKPSPTVSPALAPPPPTDESPDANGKAGDGRPAAPGGSPGRAAPVGARRPSQPRSKKRKGRGRR
jgi:YidC/Oxa1 family membrane protein insertase